MENKKKLLNMFGLCRRAGKLVWGYDAAVSAVRSGEAIACFAAADISEKTFSNLSFECERAGMKAARIDAETAELSFACGSRAGVFAVCDHGFADRISELEALVRADSPEE